MKLLHLTTVATIGLLSATPAMAQYLTPPEQVPNRYVPSVNAPAGTPSPAMTEYSAPSTNTSMPDYNAPSAAPAPVYTDPNAGMPVSNPPQPIAVPAPPQPGATVYSAPMGSASQPEANGDFASGGVGGSDQEYMKSIEKNYTLKVLFAGKSGDYLAIVNVTLTDKSGATLYNQATDGPIFLARLKPGTYKIHAELDGSTADTKVTVGKGLKSIIIRL